MNCDGIICDLDVDADNRFDLLHLDLIPESLSNFTNFL